MTWFIDLDICIHFLQRLQTKTVKHLELWKDVDLWSDELSFVIHPDIIGKINWALKTNYLSTYLDNDNKIEPVWVLYAQGNSCTER